MDAAERQAQDNAVIKVGRYVQFIVAGSSPQDIVFTGQGFGGLAVGEFDCRRSMELHRKQQAVKAAVARHHYVAGNMYAQLQEATLFLHADFGMQLPVLHFAAFKAGEECIVQLKGICLDSCR